jgi:hypothetical protein
MANVLLEEVGPNGNLQAVVESEEDVCYFYIFSEPETKFGMRSVWVRNYGPAPKSIDGDRMRKGHPPCNPAAYCADPAGSPAPDADALNVVWLPEGNGVALYENHELLAIIPPWSGQSGFHGYAREAIGEGPVAWELAEDNVLIKRFKDAALFWDSWNDETWPNIQDNLISRLEGGYGEHSNYYAIDDGEWPPKAILRIPRTDGTVLVTIGVSLRPQPNVELSTESPEQFRRIELGALLPLSWSDADIKRFASYLSAQSGLPWSKYTWLGAGHTIHCDSWLNPEFPFAILQHEHPALPDVTLDRQTGDPVNLLWFLPISAEERTAAMENGSESVVKQLPALRWQNA